jgi:hypothetical protein
MRNSRFIVLIALIPGFWCCSNDLDLVVPGEPAPVVYFRMNPSDSLFYVTLTRTFSGAGNGFDLARDPQKVFYENADIRLESWIGEYKVGEIRFSPSTRTKNPGHFPEVPGYCFEAYNKLSAINEQDIIGLANTFRLVVDVSGKLGPANATVPLIPLPVAEIEARWNKLFDLYPPDSSHYFVGFKIDHKYISHCELLCRFRYQELAGTWTDRSVNFTLRKDMKITVINGEYYATTIIYPDLFYNKLATSIRPRNDTIRRRFSSLDLIFIAGDQWYKDYSETYINSGNLDAAPSGNINNGYGLFTMIRSVENRNMKVSLKTLDSLAGGQYSKGLGFTRW